MYLYLHHFLQRTTAVCTMCENYQYAEREKYITNAHAQHNLSLYQLHKLFETHGHFVKSHSRENFVKLQVKCYKQISEDIF